MEERASKPNGIAVLMEFHNTVREKLKELRAIEQILVERDLSLQHDAVARASEIAEYLQYRTPEHEKDETQTLFPKVLEKLAQLGEDETMVAQSVTLACDEHTGFRELWSQLQHWLWMITTPDALVSLEDFHFAIGAVERHMLLHFQREEQLIFRTAAKVLSHDELSEVAQAIYDRRAADIG